MAWLSDQMTTWASFYANHAVVRTVVAFFHVSALVIGGGIALAADRATLVSFKRRAAGRRVRLDALPGTHGIVVAALVLVGISGVLLFAADADTYLYSRLFWIKMGLVVLLAVNGVLILAAERRLGRGDQGAWLMLRRTALASIALWLLITLGGVALPNVG